MISIFCGEIVQNISVEVPPFPQTETVVSDYIHVYVEGFTFDYSLADDFSELFVVSLMYPEVINKEVKKTDFAVSKTFAGLFFFFFNLSTFF